MKEEIFNQLITDYKELEIKTTSFDAKLSSFKAFIVISDPIPLGSPVNIAIFSEYLFMAF